MGVIGVDIFLLRDAPLLSSKFLTGSYFGLNLFIVRIIWAILLPSLVTVDLFLTSLSVSILDWLNILTGSKIDPVGVPLKITDVSADSP